MGIPLADTRFPVLYSVSFTRRLAKCADETAHFPHSRLLVVLKRSDPSLVVLVLVLVLLPLFPRELWMT